MKVLVTGANGMVGRAVVSAAPAEVTSLRSQVGPDRADPVPGSGTSGGLDRGASIVCDIADREAIGAVADGVDVVVHLAGPPSVAASFADPIEFLRAHVLGTATIVQLCQELAIPRLVYVSSAEVYGRPRRNPVDEGEPLVPRSPYGAAKVGAESIIGAAATVTGLDAIVLRPFSVYGPGTRRDSVLGVILEQALAGPSMQLRSLGGIRDYCFVGDLAEAVWRAARADLVGLHTFNIASGHGTRVDELARATLVARHGAVPADATVEARPDPDGDRPATADIAELVADVRQARDRLGWQATTSLTDGLVRTLDWYARTNAAVAR